MSKTSYHSTFRPILDCLSAHSSINFHLLIRLRFDYYDQKCNRLLVVLWLAATLTPFSALLMADNTYCTTFILFLRLLFPILLRPSVLVLLFEACRPLFLTMLSLITLGYSLIKRVLFSMYSF